MRPSKRARWLDEIIRNTRPGRAPAPDYEAWRAANPEAIESLRRRVSATRHSSSFRAVLRTWAHQDPLVLLGAAAVLMAAIAPVVAPLFTDEIPPEAADTALLKGQSAHIETAEDELALAERLYAQEDAEGLLILLRTGQTRVKWAAAHYLGRLGRLEAVPVLRPLAEQWRGDAQENPFRRAIEEIQRLNNPTAPRQVGVQTTAGDDTGSVAAPEQ